MSNLANFVTGLSLLCGFVSIVFSLENHFSFACWAIILSVIFDGLDGQIARKISSTSEFGKEFDSLVDVISFGIAPSVLGYIFLYQTFGLLTTAALFIYLFCGVIRLARYNITPKEKMANYFYGLPTTVSGGVIASYILMYTKYSQLPPAPVLLSLVLCLAFLMVSRVRYLNLDGVLRFLGNKVIFVILAAATIWYFFDPGSALFTIFLIYLIFFPFVVKFVNPLRQ